MSVADVATLTWMCAAAWQDLRVREVSNWLTVPPLLLAVAWNLVCGNGLPAALLVTMLMTDWLVEQGLMCVGLFTLICVVAAVVTGDVVVPVVWAAAYMAACLNFAGGADAKIAMTLVTLYPAGGLAGLMLAAICALTVVAAIVQRKTPQATATGSHRVWPPDFPTRKELESRGTPLVGSLALAFCVWLIVRGV